MLTCSIQSLICAVKVWWLAVQDYGNERMNVECSELSPITVNYLTTSFTALHALWIHCLVSHVPAPAHTAA